MKATILPQKITYRSGDKPQDLIKSFVIRLCRALP